MNAPIRRRRAWLGITLAVLAGCDTGSGGPSAPAPTAPSTGEDPGKVPPKGLPLKKVGEPIGSALPGRLFRIS